MKYILSFQLLLLTYFIQNTTYNSSSLVTIRVMDNQNNFIQNARIIIKQRGAILYTGITDSDGLKTFDLPVGEFSISISKASYLAIKDTDFNPDPNKNIYTFILQKQKALHPEKFISDEKKIPTFKERAIAETAYTSTFQSELPGSGQITAGEWNDLHNWKLWDDLLKQNEYNKMEDFWGFYTRGRYSITILNHNNIPIPNIPVDLLDEENNILWTGQSDLSGKVELWENVFNGNAKAKKAIAYYDDKIVELEKLQNVNNGSNIIKINTSCNKNITMDIAFVVDATSSMQDEIKYLQSELIDVIQQVESSEKKIRWSSLFYRDHDEAYLTKASDFSKDKNQLLDFIKNQSAEGGGDYPEEVSEALFQAVNNLNWRKNVSVKLLFLILDAPPHDTPESLKKYKNAVKSAAAKGIKIIPVTASGINRYTEFLMKFTAILSNGTYVFITDDSGIGHSHLDPVVSDFEVETLNDLLVRLINNYSKPVPCNDILLQSEWLGKIYPNPASEYVHIDEVQRNDLLQIIASSGMNIKSHIVHNESIARIDISTLTPGSYFIKITRSGKIFTRPILIIR